ncbi:unnamed protein product (macronuclear) [Paramecium tetraurelia]|uniref:Uncharacterized protein n=1 Tax=Paramecium tetraurelia TaxID=5888 RepID=A0BSP1_PARTE|nr:uncharacterized protein GSPATT00031790001 [Paramecium tetraurelia]CAK61558.1 unnamed protein product [Paramecium tetraurelia]|eukprot:XP_001428956.1 hypothetical protein (macronuclear) [Paramecium tetraurelia strain d4-2]
MTQLFQKDFEIESLSCIQQSSQNMNSDEDIDFYNYQNIANDQDGKSPIKNNPPSNQEKNDIDKKDEGYEKIQKQQFQEKQKSD